jgi:hypothetical protein
MVKSSFRTYKKKYSSYKKADGFSKKISSLSKKVYGLKRRVEYRINTISATDVNIDNLGTEWLINGMTTGDSDGQREGTKIIMKSFRINLDLNINKRIGANFYNQYRVILLLDKQPNKLSVFGVGAAHLDPILEDSSVPFHSQKLWTNNDRLVFLFDQLVEVDTYDSRVTMSKFIKLGQITQYALAAASDITGITTNALWLLIVSDCPPQVGEELMPTVTFNARLVYNP